MTNPCLRQASLQDIPLSYLMQRSSLRLTGYDIRELLIVLYDAEWRLRGFEKSP